MLLLLTREDLVTAVSRISGQGKQNEPADCLEWVVVGGGGGELVTAESRISEQPHAAHSKSNTFHVQNVPGLP